MHPPIFLKALVNDLAEADETVHVRSVGRFGARAKVKQPVEPAAIESLRFILWEQFDTEAASEEQAR